jgi:spore maturation protein SpmA
MLNYVWLGLMVLAVIIGGWNGRLGEVAAKSFDWANTSVVTIAFGLIGLMTLWLGIMRLAERAGLVALLARALRPVMRWIFPEVPADHPAMGSMLMNMAANMLGLGNAATPLGLRAMKDLESLNPRPGIATNAMCTFLAINTSGVQLVPVTAVAILAANKSNNPTAIVGTALIGSLCAAVAGVLMAKFLSRLPIFQVRAHGGQTPAVPAGASGAAAAPADNERSAVQEAATLQPLRWWGGVILGAFLLFFAFLFLQLVMPETSGQIVSADAARPGTFVRLVNAVSLLSVPFLLSAIPLFAALRRVKVYEEFVDGAKEGFQVAIRIIPYLVAILVAMGMFRAAGGIELLSHALSPVLDRIGFPTDLVPMVLVRPLSGSAALGFFTELVKNFGPDSFVARMAGTIYGSTETTFYVLAVYFGSVAVTRTRHALLAGLTADFVSVVVAFLVCKLMFG